MKKTLIVHSIDDSMAQRRIQLFNESPQTDNYEIYHAFAVRSLDVDLTLNELIFKLKLPINSFNPEFVIFHTGAAFCKQPEIFKQCVIFLKKQYPIIKFCYEPKAVQQCYKYFDLLDEFTRNKETADIVTLLFFKIYNRKIPLDSWICQQF